MTTTAPLKKEELYPQLRNILANVLDWEIEDIHDDLDLNNEEIDSVMRLEIMVNLERIYEIKFDQEDLTRITTLDDMINLITEKHESQYGNTTV